MADFRRDPISGRWVIIAEERGRRPSEFPRRSERRSITPCPFCPEHEAETPEAVAVYRSAGTGQCEPWSVRVIPNKYPAATLAAEPRGTPLDRTPNLPPSSRAAERDSQLRDSQLRDSQPGIGVHEVIVESPRHVDSLTDLTDCDAGLVMNVYRDRLAAMQAIPSLQYAVIFKNCRGDGGATLEHVHSQLLGTAFVPAEIERELETAATHFHRTKSCLLCDLLDQELHAARRVVDETDHFIAFCPFASRFPYETWILPREHGSRFEQCDPRRLTELGTLVRRRILRLEQQLENCAYNYWIRSAPYRTACEEIHHWRFELIPRVTTPGGYEWGTGSFVNPVSPETAAQLLRSPAR